MLININGKLIPENKAGIPITDLGLLRGYAVFDFFRVINEIPVFMEDHLQRLEHSARYLNLPMPASPEKLKTEILDLIKANKIESSGIRIQITGGSPFSEDGQIRPNYFIQPLIIPELSHATKLKGISLLTSDYQREHAEAKTTNYSNVLMQEPRLKNSGAIDLLYHKDGVIRETSRANFFIVTNQNTIVTTGERILKGISRKKLLEFAEGIYPIEVRDLAFEELDSAAEAFITSTTKEVTPVVKIDERLIGNGKPGPVTLDLMSQFRKLVVSATSIKMKSPSE